MWCYKVAVAFILAYEQTVLFHDGMRWYGVPDTFLFPKTMLTNINEQRTK